MSAIDLSISPVELASVVEAVLAGTDIDRAATAAGITTAQLGDAIDTYRTAGAAALYHRNETAWFHAFIAPADWDDAEYDFSSHIGPCLDATGAKWWFLRKYPHWRVRVNGDSSRTNALFDDLASTARISRWHQGIYEPEAAAFGGAAATAVIHDLFCADTAGLLDHLRRCPGANDRRELSLFLLRTLYQHAGLDPFEIGDVYDKVAQIRPEPTEPARVKRLAGQIEAFLHSFAGPIPEWHPLAHINPWQSGFSIAGRELGRLAHIGGLDRGLRAVLAQIVVFHWNRVGFSATAQGVLAHAARTAMLPHS